MSYYMIVEKIQISQNISKLKSNLLQDNETLMNRVLSSDFDNFCQRNFKKLIVNGEEMSFNQILSFNENFLGVITKVPKKYVKYVESFFYNKIQLIRGITNKEEFETRLLKLLKQVFNLSPTLRTELVLQVIKMTRSQLQTDQIKAWQILAVIASYIKVQDTFLYYLLNFINTCINEESNYLIQKYAQFTYLNFIRNASIGERTIIPVISQIKAIIQLQKLKVKIYLTGEKYITGYFEVYDNMEEVKFQLMNLLHLPREYHPMFQMYEIITYNSYQDESSIEDFVRLADVLGTFSHIFVNNRHVFNGRNPIENAKYESDQMNDERQRIYFRMSYFQQDNSCGPLLKQIQQKFALASFLISFYYDQLYITKPDKLFLVAFIVRVKFKKFGLKFMKEIQYEIKEVIRQYSQASKLDKQVSEQDVFEEIQNYSKTSLDDMELLFLKKFYRTAVWQSDIFPAQFYSNIGAALKIQKTVFILVNCNVVSITDTSFSVKKKISYNFIEKIYLKDKYLVMQLIPNNLSESEQAQKDTKKFDHVFLDGNRIRLVFELPQAEKLYLKLVNYISLKINGYFTQQKIGTERTYKDRTKLALDMNVLEKAKKDSGLEKNKRFMRQILL